jgi:hypothetical protein
VLNLVRLALGRCPTTGERHWYVYEGEVDDLRRRRLVFVRCAKCKWPTVRAPKRMRPRENP